MWLFCLFRHDHGSFCEERGVKKMDHGSWASIWAEAQLITPNQSSSRVRSFNFVCSSSAGGNKRTSSPTEGEKDRRTCCISQGYYVVLLCASPLAGCLPFSCFVGFPAIGWLNRIKHKSLDCTSSTSRVSSGSVGKKQTLTLISDGITSTNKY